MKKLSDSFLSTNTEVGKKALELLSNIARISSSDIRNKVYKFREMILNMIKQTNTKAALVDITCNYNCYANSAKYGIVSNFSSNFHNRGRFYCKLTHCAFNDRFNKLNNLCFNIHYIM